MPMTGKEPKTGGRLGTRPELMAAAVYLIASLMWG
jgi:hypothetical protein